MANFLFVLSQDNNEKATRCFQFAQIAHSKGHGVNLFSLMMARYGQTLKEI